MAFPNPLLVPGFLYWDGFKYILIPTVSIPPVGPANGDLSGTYPNPFVAKIQGNPVKHEVLGVSQDGYLLTWKSADGEWEALPIDSAITLFGDVTGNAATNTVVKIQGTPVSSGAVTNDGYALVSVNDVWTPTGVAPVFNVKNFGAKGNGVHDDTAAINQALNAATSSKGIVFFPPGTYLISGTLTLPVGVTIQGSGFDSTTIQKNTPGDILLSSHAINFGAAAFTTVTDIGVYNSATFGLSNWQASTLYASGNLVQLNGRVLLKCITGGTSGSFRPVGQLTWITPNSTTPYIGPAITMSGTPSGTFNWLIKIIVGGIVGTATFQYSTNNGSSWSSTMTTGATVSLTGGISAHFAAGTYVINTYAASPTFGWSLVTGTNIADGSVTWQIVDGGAGFTDVGGTYVTLRNFKTLGCNCGIIFDQTEVSNCDNIILQYSGWAGIWLANGVTHTSNADYGFIAGIHISNFDVAFAQIGIVDDGGASHTFNGGVVSSASVNWGYFAALSTLSLDNIFVESSGDGYHGANEYQLPDLSSFLATVGPSVNMSISNCSADLNAGALMNVISPLSLFNLVAKNCYTEFAMFKNIANCYTFSDLGGNRCQDAALVDAMPHAGGIFTTSVSNNQTGLPGLYWGIGINAFPQFGITNNAGFSLVPAQLTSIVGGAQNDNVVLLAQSCLYITTFTSGSGAYSITGFQNSFFPAGGTSIPRDGQIIRLYNFTNVALTLKHKTGSSAGYQISSPTGANVIVNVFADLQYIAASGYWELITYDTIALGGDVTGPAGTNTVVKIQGTPVSSASVVNDGYALVSTGDVWTPMGVEPVFNVRNFGALGNNVHDDAPAINAAITAASVAGGIVYIPAGLYICASNINVASRIIIRGAGRPSELIFTNNSSLIINTLISVLLEAFNVRSFDITCLYGIHIIDSYYITMNKMWVTGGQFTQAGIFIEAVALNNAQINMYDVDVESNAGDGIKFHDDLFQSVNLYNCNISGNDGYGINQLQRSDLTSGSQLIMNTCLVEGNTKGEINAESLYNSYFMGCHFEQALGSLVPLVTLGNLAVNGRARGITFDSSFFNGGSAPILVSVPLNDGYVEGLTFNGCSFFNDVGSSIETPNPVALGIAGVNGLNVVNCFIAPGAPQMSMFNLTDGNCTGIEVLWRDTAAVINFIADAAIDLSVVGGFPGTLPGGHNRGQDCFYPSKTLQFTGSLGSAQNVIVPIGSKWQKTFINNAAQTITIIGNTGTGVSIGNGETAILRSDGTNVVRVTAEAPGLRQNVTPVAHGASPYTVLFTDNVIAADSTLGVITINLPASPLTGDTYQIKDSTGQAATNNVTVAGNGHNIDGAATFVINVNYSSINVVFTGSIWNIL